MISHVRKTFISNFSTCKVLDEGRLSEFMFLYRYVLSYGMTPLHGTYTKHILYCTL